jgi:16S rRNA (cytosine967-C5)-methyltransferase
MLHVPADPRALAAQVLVQVRIAGRSLSEVLPAATASCIDPRDGALLQELVYGTVRWFFRLDALLEQLLRKPFKTRDADLHSLLLVGLYQLDRLAVPEHVAVHETVQAVRTLGKDWAIGLANAVLRGFQRRRNELEAAIVANDEARYSHPLWLIEQLRLDWPDRYEQILEANNMRPPFNLRVNRRRISRSEYLELLHSQAVEAEPIPGTDQGIRLATPLAVARLPGFFDGNVSVQDGAAQLAAKLLDVHPGMRVLDACSAPGGKTAHLLELEPEIALTAMDIDGQRLVRVQENLDRLGLHAVLITADAGNPGQWWDGLYFDRILLDAPCTGTGVIRRHPDIKLLRRAADIGALTQRQAELLKALWPLLSPGGILLYCTCSVLKAENCNQVAVFLNNCADAVECPTTSDHIGGGEVGRQIMPGENGMDGFYYACIRKTV